MKPMALFDLLRHDPAKSTAIGLIAIALILVGFEIISGLKGLPSFSDQKTKVVHTKPKIVINESAPVLTFPLFGAYMPVNLADMAIKKSTLDLEVVGILYSSDEKSSQVIIRSAGGLEATYLVNDTLPGDVVIKKINTHGIIVLHNGVLEGLDIKKNELRFEAPPQPLIKE